MQWTDLTLLDILLLVILPAAAGAAVTESVCAALKKRHSTPLLVRGTRILLSLIWISIVIVGVYVVFGPFSFLSTLTLSGIAGIAVALALQTTLQNILAGFLLARHNFLKIGDKIQFSGLKGTIASIGLVTVVVRLDTGELASISNSNLLSGPLVNVSATGRLAGEY
jgi:small conductance mechanosensitive channel